MGNEMTMGQEYRPFSERHGSILCGYGKLCLREIPHGIAITPHHGYWDRKLTKFRPVCTQVVYTKVASEKNSITLFRMYSFQDFV